MDNLSAKQYFIDVCGMYDQDIAILSMDQEKVFNHVCLFSTLRAFGFEQVKGKSAV